MKKIGLIVIVAILGLLVFGFFRIRALQKENARLTQNQHSLLTDIVYYKTKDSLSAASVEKLTLTTKEMKEHEASLVKEIETLDLKLKRVQSISQTAVTTKYEFKTVIRDSIIVNYKDSLLIDTIQCYTYHDRWLDFENCEGNVSIATKDSLLMVVSRVPKNYLWGLFKCGTKGIKMDVKSSNPYSEIDYVKYIELKK
jgi:hypothetical protein